MSTQVVTSPLGEAQVEADVVYGTGGGRDLHLDIYTPATRDGLAPGVLLIHGGGWRIGAKNMPGIAAFGTLLSQMGYVCASMEYRLSGESAWPAQLDDAKAALRWFRANADRLGVDPARIVVLGKSAGAHIALMLGATQDDPAHDGEGGTPGISTKLDAIVTFYPPTMLTRRGIAESDAVRSFLADNHGPESLEAISPISYVGTKPFPPTILLHGTTDVVVSPGDSTAMYDALRKAGVPVELHMYAGLPHGFENDNPRMQRHCADVIDMFLSRHLAG